MDSSNSSRSLLRGQHVVAAAGLVLRQFDQELRVLALRRAHDNRAGPGLWETVSGRVEHGESPLVAVQREIVEESGLVAQVESRPFASYAAERRGLPMIVILFRARYLSGEVALSHEHDAAEWLDGAAFRARSTLLPLVTVVEQALSDPSW
jgi:8-oxo-dGTP pyrophosphatase MutT (NUDIX family)